MQPVWHLPQGRYSDTPILETKGFLGRGAWEEVPVWERMGKGGKGEWEMTYWVALGQEVLVLPAVPRC